MTQIRTVDIHYNTNNGSAVDIRLSVPAYGSPSASVVSSSGPDHADIHQNTTINLLEPAGTVINYDGSQAQQQANVLKQLCVVDTAPTCKFTPTSEAKVAGPEHQVGDAFTNATDNLTGVYFDSPAPTFNGDWSLKSQPVNGGPITSTVLH